MRDPVLRTRFRLEYQDRAVDLLTLISAVREIHCSQGVDRRQPAFFENAIQEPRTPRFAVGIVIISADKLIAALKNQVLEVAKSFGWDSWIKVEVNVERVE